MRKTLKDGCKVALASGATELVAYSEYDGNKERGIKRQGQYWIAEMTLAHGRIACQQAYDEKTKKRTTRAFVRRKCAELLDAIAPGWTIVDAPNTRVLP